MSRKRYGKRLNRIFMICICLLFGVLTGYAAFNTNVNLKAKGNVKETNTAESLKSKVVTSGDGLYLDITEVDRYIYKGVNPDNYIKLGNDLYRIISIESDNTLKVVKDKMVSSMVYDSMSSRESSDSSDYCYNDYGNTYYGCNVWGNKYTMLDKNENNITQINGYNLPEKEATLNTYLNNDWYNGLSSDVQKLIVPHIFNVGAVSDGNVSLEDSVEKEKNYKWQGKIGLINATDYVKVSLDSEKCGTIYLNSNISSNTSKCVNSNWMYLSFGSNIFVMLTPVSDSRWPVNWVWINLGAAAADRTLFGMFDASSVGGGGYFDIVPSFYLSSDIKFTGNGEKTTPYVILD